MTLSEGVPCPSHPQSVAIARCDSCSRPLCKLCAVEDGATDSTYCSATCRDARQRIAGTPPPLGDAELLYGLNHPILAGWKLWARSSKDLLVHTAPLAVVIGFLFSAFYPAGENSTLLWVLLAVLMYGVALVQVILSWKYTGKYAGRAGGSAYMWAGRRILPWLAAVVLSLGASFAGLLALVFPGIYLGLRLFWADEFALMHGTGPVASLRESWDLTRSQAGAVFRFQFIAGLAGYVVYLVGIVLMAGVVNLGINQAPGLQTFLLGTCGSLILLTGYAALHAPEIVYLYGMRAERARGLSNATRILAL